MINHIDWSHDAAISQTHSSNKLSLRLGINNNNNNNKALHLP